MTASAHSGKPLDEITVDAALRSELFIEDIRISRETLLEQAEVAEKTGSRQLAENLRRAAEMTALDTDEVLDMYEALRPGRSTKAELEDIAARLESIGAHACAAFVLEAASVYERRQLLR